MDLMVNLYDKNKMGPKFDPCGVPCVKAADFEKYPPALTEKDQLVRHD